LNRFSRHQLVKMSAIELAFTSDDRQAFHRLLVC
jgi:hypothetical protein